MEVKLIAMTDAVCNGKPAGSSLSPEQVCNHAARTCTSEDAGILIDTGYFEGEPFPMWNGLGVKPLLSALRSGHESVLEHAVYTFEVKGVSRALTHQLVRHRIASYSQQSQRYVNMDGFEYVTPESIRDCPNSLEQFEWGMKAIQKVYKTMLDYGISEEDARYILPNACTTNIVVTMNARSLRNFFTLRCCTRAQEETRELAEKMLKICKEVSPLIFEDAGPSCVRDGFCREQRSCGRAPKLKKVLQVMSEMEVDG